MKIKALRIIEKVTSEKQFGTYTCQATVKLAATELWHQLKKSESMQYCINCIRRTIRHSEAFTVNDNPNGNSPLIVRLEESRTKSDILQRINAILDSEYPMNAGYVNTDDVLEIIRYKDGQMVRDDSVLVGIEWCIAEQLDSQGV